MIIVAAVDKAKGEAEDEAEAEAEDAVEDVAEELLCRVVFIIRNVCLCNK